MPNGHPASSSQKSQIQTDGGANLDLLDDVPRDRDSTAISRSSNSASAEDNETEIDFVQINTSSSGGKSPQQ